MRLAAVRLSAAEAFALRADDKNQLLLFIDGDAADFLTVRASAFGSNRRSPTIIGYCVGAGLNCFSGFRTYPIYVVSVDWRVGGCVEYRIACCWVGLPIVHVREACRPSASDIGDRGRCLFL